MPRPRVLDLGEGRQLIDLDFRDHEGLIAAYLLPAPDGRILVETGPTSCRASLLAGLAAAGVEPTAIRRVFVTHIHLDHAGGLGALGDDLPNATFYAHEFGVPHLIDPTKLVASARRAWGAAADPLWGSIEPIRPDRIVPLRGGETFPLTRGRLEVLATPGHARHHLSFWDSAARALLTGDSAGVRLETGGPARPAVPPPDLDLDALFRSLATMEALDPEWVLYSHFGPSAGGAPELADYAESVARWRDTARSAALERPSVEHVAAALHELDRQECARRGVPYPREDPASLVSSYSLAAQGLLRYLEHTGGLPRRAN